MRSYVDTDAGRSVLTALQRGASVAEASAAAHMNMRTIRNWIFEGRRRPASVYGPFAAAVDQRSRRVRVVPPAAGLESDSSLPDRRELLELLAEQACRGHVRALELMLREVPPEPDSERRELARRLLSLVPGDET
jgi:hypothetical protein